MIANISGEFILAQNKFYETETMLQTQIQHLAEHINMVEQQNWDQQKTIWSLESELAKERQKSSENAESL
ncbi:hypothetical protein N7448_011150 [Penicillium atrosanguineum]|nr:hypothetical protein N7448_011150 [Penicillium atrosanguineum]